MATEIRLHIGPPKTGSTTVQSVLASRRENLLARGVLYPGPRKHGYALIRPIAQWDNGRRLGFEVPAEQVAARRNEKRWTRFLRETKAHAGPVIVSAEALSGLSRVGIEEFLRALDTRRVHVVLVDRPVSRAIPSWHQECAKRWCVPDFETHARLLLGWLLDPGTTPTDFLSAQKIASRWGAFVDDVTVVRGRPDVSAQVLSRVAVALAPELETVTVDARANPSLSAVGTQVWQAHIRAHQPPLAAGGLAVLERLRARFPQTTDPSLGGRLALVPDVAGLADAAAQGGIAEAHRLSRVLESSQPVTQPVPALAGTERILEELARWQRRENAKWALLDVASRAAARGRLTPGMWASDATHDLVGGLAATDSEPVRTVDAQRQLGY